MVILNLKPQLPMQVRHRVTGKMQNLSKDEFDVLKSTGHAKNFDVIQETDYVPDELKLPTAAAPDAKAKDKKADDASTK
ncbi:hypothetical protein [Spirosoma sp. 48-14]|uniref:hypothetical protein n=1 Tax=Spirosoma sp. 48-14 TaxID=1895854 RepID=UPI00095ABB48|nr:hypothetical protein [Spirosoma sp. 48-14]OJW75710.1 MAG: hypothetical protein BGO59_09090 [Spirosoma sp. 48-14]